MKINNLKVCLGFILGLIILAGCKNSLPTVVINTPANNASYFQGQNIDFSSTVSDEEDITISDENIIWTSDKDGELGKGKTLSKNNLSENTHIITVTVSDSKEDVASTQITVIVKKATFSFGNITPVNNDEYIETELITFTCVPSFEDGTQIEPEKVKWTSDKDGLLGTGLNLEKKLSANSHIVTVSYEGQESFNTDINLAVLENSIYLDFNELPYNEYNQDYEIDFSCNAENLDLSAIPAENIVWTSDKDGGFGSGYSFSYNNLSVNTHQITISVENEQGRTAEHTFSITINGNTEADFELLLNRMTGYFSSEAHADTTTNQYIVDVRLHMAQIWDDRNVGENIYWLYVEQAYADDLENPYRQRIYKVMMDEDGTIHDDIYSIPNASTYKHGYLTPEIFDPLLESQLILKDDCGLTFALNNQNIFEGGTIGTGCAATIPGLPQVSYITSVSTIGDDFLTSWDRGYSTSGAWLLGPDWPYIFDLITDYGFTSSE